MPLAPTGMACHWDIIESMVRNAKKPIPVVPPWQRTPNASYDLDNLPKYCQAGHKLLDSAVVNDRGLVVCGRCMSAPSSRATRPRVPFEFETTGGKGLQPYLIEHDKTTRADTLRNEQLTRLGCIRQQLARNQTIVWNTPDEAGEWHRPDLPQGIGIYVWPLSDDERQALTQEANALRKVLHV